METTLNPIRDAIVATLAGVAGIGQVHGWERYAKDKSGLSRLYIAQGEDGDQLRGWYVRRLGFRRERNGGGRPRVFTRWQIRGFLAIRDEERSELVFDQLIDALVAAFAADPTLAGTVIGCWDGDGAAGPQLEASGPVMFAGVLCHAADLLLTTESID